MVQLSTPWGDPQPGNGPPVRRFLSNYFDLLFIIVVPYVYTHYKIHVNLSVFLPWRITHLIRAEQLRIIKRLTLL